MNRGDVAALLRLFSFLRRHGTLDTMSRIVPKLLQQSLGRIAQLPRPQQPRDIEKIDESLTPNMRALRLSMSIAEQLLSMGVAAHDVVHMTLGITDTYCRRKVHVDISSTLIIISQDRGVTSEPLTLVRVIVPDDANYQRMQALQMLATEIRDVHTPLHEAEERLAMILARSDQHSRWILCAAGGAVSAGVVILYNGSVLMTALSFCMGFVATAVLRWLGRLGVSTFYSQVIVAVLVTVAAAAVALLNTVLQLEVNTTLLVISGIVLLVAGMMIVGAFQDAIDEYYVTANARLLKVMMATGGIVVGVMGGLYVATRMGISFPATPDRLSYTDAPVQYFGALLVAAAFALKNHAKVMGVIIAGVVGTCGWALSQALTSQGFSTVFASGVAAAVIGLVAVLTSRLWRFPSVAIIAAGVVPLVPGLSLYNGLMGMVLHPPSDPYFMTALAVLARAIMIGLAVATGASLGSLVGRPLRRKIKQTFLARPQVQ